MPTVTEIITENILKQLEQGVAPWRKPWSTSVPRNLISKKPYRGLNVFLLATQGYGSPCWVTFNQAKQLRAHVRQGEKSTLVSFWKFNEYATENRETGETENKTSVLLRYYRVFNIEQCDGLSALLGDDKKISLHEDVDTSTPNGRLVFGIFASIAEFERELIRDRRNWVSVSGPSITHKLSKIPSKHALASD